MCPHPKYDLYNAGTYSFTTSFSLVLVSVSVMLCNKSLKKNFLHIHTYLFFFTLGRGCVCVGGGGAFGKNQQNSYGQRCCADTPVLCTAQYCQK